MIRGVVLLLALLLAIGFVVAVDIPQGIESIDDLPLEVREQLPPDFTLDDIPENFSQEDLQDIANEYNISITDILGDDVSQEKLQSLCNLFLKSFDFEDAQIPSYVPFTYDVFNLYTLDNLSVAYVQIADKKIVNVNCSAHHNATYEIYVKDLDVLTRVAGADYILDAYRHERKQGNIKIKGIRFGAMVKTAVLHAAIGIMALFG